MVAIGAVCAHKDLLPLTGMDIGLFCILFIALTFCSAAGVGGGGIMVPLLLLMTEFDSDTAIPLSVTAIFGGTIARACIQVP